MYLCRLCRSFPLSPPPQSEKLMLFDTLQERLLERIQRLEEDRHSVGLTSGEGGSAWPAPTPLWVQGPSFWREGP